MDLRPLFLGQGFFPKVDVWSQVVYRAFCSTDAIDCKGSSSAVDFLFFLSAVKFFLQGYMSNPLMILGREENCLHPLHEEL